MDTVIFAEKATTEIIPLTVTFADRLQYGETINGASVSVIVISGTDANPSAMLSGAVVTAPTSVTQNITGGIAGVVYMVVFLVTATGSHNYAKEGRLVVTAPGAF
jgi:hypothetical protein